MSRMSSEFLPRGETPPHDDLVTLKVYPEDHARLKALSGIWPVEDTVRRMIDVFIATNAASASQALRAQPGTHAPTAQIVETGHDDAQTEPEAQASGKEVIRPQKVEPRPRTARADTATSRAGKRKNRTGSRSRSGKATAKPVPQASVLTFGRTDCPDLRFATLSGFTFGDVTCETGKISWCDLYNEAITQALAAGHGLEALAAAKVRAYEGKPKNGDYRIGFRFLERTGLSVQISSSNYMFSRILRLCDLAKAPMRVGVQWKDMPQAAHPGRSGLISVKPMPLAMPGTAKDCAEGRMADAVFPVEGALVSFVYADRTAEEKLVQLVADNPDPAAGQVSVASPLGRALLETPVGDVAQLELKGMERKIRVLDVTTV